MSIKNEGGDSAGTMAVVFSALAATAWLLAVTVTHFPTWPIWGFGGLTAFSLYMHLAADWKVWPYARSVGESSTGTVEPSAADQDLNAVDGPGALDTVASSPGSAPDAPTPLPTPELTPAVTDRWRHTSEGLKVPTLMNLTHTTMSHPGYRGQSRGETPSVKIGVIVGCEPMDASSSGSALRAKFVAFLNSAGIRELVASLTYVAPGASWTSLAGRGVLTLEAALTTGDDPMDGVPVASALFLPPTGAVVHGRAQRTATLVLYLEPLMPDGQPPSAAGIGRWHRKITRALAVPGAFADFLSTDLELDTAGAPPAQFGVWLESHYPLTTMVNTSGLRTLPGASSSNQFMGWAYADPDGKSASAVARDMMIHMCEYTLQLDDFESELPVDVA